MMSDYEILVNNFVHLLKNQPSLFSEEDRITLIELIKNQADDIESLSNAISSWCEEHPKVDEALAEYEEIKEKAPGEAGKNIDIPKYQLDKEHIITTIEQGSSSAEEKDKPTPE